MSESDDDMAEKHMKYLMHEAIRKLRLQRSNGATKAQRRLLELNVVRWLGDLFLPMDLQLDGLSDMAKELGDIVHREAEVARDTRTDIDRELVAIAISQYYTANPDNSRSVADARRQTETLLDLPTGQIAKLVRKYKRSSRAAGLEGEPISRGDIVPDKDIASHLAYIRSGVAGQNGEVSEAFIVFYYSG